MIIVASLAQAIKALVFKKQKRAVDAATSKPSKYSLDWFTSSSGFSGSKWSLVAIELRDLLILQYHFNKVYFISLTLH